MSLRPTLTLLSGTGGNPTPAQADSSGNLKTTGAGGGGGGTSEPDEAAFVAGTTPGTPIMGYDTSTGEVLIVALSPGTRNLATAVTVTPVTSNITANQAQTTVGVASVQLLAANAGRKRLVLQNTGLTRIYIGLGFTPTATVYSFSLPQCGNSNDGSSPLYLDTMWTGIVNAIGSAVGGTVVVSENT